MIIAVNTQTLLKDKLEGLGSFTDEVLSRIVRNHPEHQFLFIFDRPWDSSFVYADNVIPIKTMLPSRHPMLWQIRFEWSIPRLLARHKADILLSTDGYMPLNPQLPTYNVIHDIGFVHSPENQPYIVSKYYNYFFPKFARNADRLGTVSEYSKSDIIKTWGINPDKIDVIYNGVKNVFAPLAAEKQQQVRAEISDGCPYFVFVGSLNPRKNVEGLLRAFDIFRQRYNQPIKLVIVGECMWSMAPIDREIEHMVYADDVVFLGHLQSADLNNIIGSALCLVLPSFLEGFGVPIVEAMNCDVPVITSDCTAMPEVAGDAGLLIDPHNDNEIADAMMRITTEPALRNQLIENAQTQRKHFSWDKSAIDLWNGMMHMIGQ